MSFAKNLILTGDDYTGAATLECPGAIKLNIEVDQAAVFYRFAVPSREQPWGGVFNPEKILKPGNVYFLFRRAAQVAFRSAVAGVPGIVSIEALTPND
jgi:hypothetical protein